MKRLAALFGKVFVYQRGRVVALALLVLFTGLVGWGDSNTARSAGNPAMTMVTSPLSLVRQFLFDRYQIIFPRARLGQPVEIVEIDEQSIKEIGQWPWPRDRLAELIEAITAYKPAAIGLDIYMPEPDQTSPEVVAQGLPAEQHEMADALKRLPSHDAQLAKALKAAPSVLGAAGFDTETFSSSAGLRTTPVDIRGAGVLEYLHRYPFVVASLPELQFAAQGQALLSIEVASVVRRIPLVSVVGEEVVPSLAMEMLRVGFGVERIQVETDERGVRSVTVKNVVVPTQASGDVWLHFAHRKEAAELRTVSARSLLNGGKVAPDALQDKLVLVGLTGSGINDWRATPLNESVPGIEIQAQLLESLLDGRMLLRPWWMTWLELGLLSGIGLLMIVLVPGALSRTNASGVRQPRHVGGWVTGVSLVLLGLGFWLFHAQGLLFDGATMSLGFAGLLASLVSSSTLEIEGENRRLAQERQQLREDSARLAGEMEAARRIQLGSLPNAQLAFPGEKRFAIDALIEPAREVGGDLYDFFLLDARRLYFLIGDVSGKGVPASLFMAVTKTLTRSFAARLAGGTEEIVSAANVDLSRDNVETLFVTMLLGVLDLESGELQLVNAGHETPWRIGADASLEQLVMSEEAGGPPLCMVDDFSYHVQRVQLHPGDRLCMVTDGITEAANAQGDLYGNRRLRAALSGLPTGPTPETITQHVRQDVGAFVNGAEASDDMAILVLHWIGPSASADINAG